MVTSDAPRSLRHPDEQGVDVGPAVLLDQMDLDRGGALQLDHGVETSPAAGAPAGIRGVGDRLQLTQHLGVDQQVPGQEAGRDQVQDPAVDQRARVHDEDLLRLAGGPRLEADETEQLLVLGPPDPEPEEPERDVRERHAGPGRQRREPEHGDREQGRDREPGHEPTDTGDDLGGRDLAELLLHRAHGGGRLPAEHAPEDEPGRRAQDHVGEGLRGGRRHAGGDRVAGRREQGDEDQTDELDQATPGRGTAFGGLPSTEASAPRALLVREHLPGSLDAAGRRLEPGVPEPGGWFGGSGACGALPRPPPSRGRRGTRRAPCRSSPRPSPRPRRWRR